MKTSLVKYLLLYPVLLGGLLTGCLNPAEEIEGLEIPAIEADDYIIGHTAYTISYDYTRRIPKWVAYQLTPDCMGSTKRGGKSFQQDEQTNLPQADNKDYSGSGYTRGHMAPAADFSATEALMWETFYFTNCCPQTEKLNNGDWQTLEKEVRSWAKKYGKVYVVTGPIVSDEGLGTIGKNKVVIPEAFFKALLVEDGNDIHTIAFVMANNNERQPMERSAASINELEEITGIDFFHELDDSVEEKIEDQYDLKFWGLLKK